MRDFHSSRWQAIVEKFLQSSSVHTIEALASVALNEEHAEKQVPRCYECWPLTPKCFRVEPRAAGYASLPRRILRSRPWSRQHGSAISASGMRGHLHDEQRQE